MKKCLLTFFILLLTIFSFAQPGDTISIKQLADSIQVIMKQEQITGLMLGFN